MSVTVENLEKSMAKLTIEVPAEEFEKALQETYQKQKGKISIPGFRKGKVPRQMIEKMYGPGIFYEDAANLILPTAYSDAAKESDLEITSSPEIEVTQVEKGKPFIFTATVAVKPEVVLGEYKGLEVKRTDVTVTDEDVQKALEKEQNKNSRQVTVEGEAVNDDTITLDYEGKIDGVAFDGGTAQDQVLRIGTNTFIPGFEEQLIGVKTGDVKEVNVTFPEKYHAEDLAGKPAVFTCTIKKITRTELPALDDEFAQDVSEFDTLEEYKADLRKTLEEQKLELAKEAKQENAITKAAENAQIEIPAPMLDTRAADIVDNFARRVESQGMSFAQYLQYAGADAATMREQVKPQAELQIRRELVLEKVAEVENLTATDEDIEAEIASMAASYNMEVEKVKEWIDDTQKEVIRKDLAARKAAEFLGESAVEVDMPEESAEEAEEKETAEE